MSDLATALSNLNRPRLLVRAARHGVSEYKRDRDLRRISGHNSSASPRRIVSHLLAQEEAIERTRVARDGTYSPNKHIEVLVALMAESRNLPAPSAAPARTPRRTSSDTGWRPTTV
ncbi:hypothetical protein C8N43_0443 [Litoreibacter ponti]|uniref:Uncharacterized protein n=1 Tax=Litoreibacter ponti TaxID=1510457 RepID=A0A2T6BIA7_9RHOB|nr:DUF6477 family protein [Litoreibacter ponti]PTX55797.1 hypothetical protein C8N43_0443 [Litoreibacter ponti]